MPTIEVDQDVYDYLRDQAEPFVETEPNAVLRRLLLAGQGRARKRPSREGQKRVSSSPVDTDAFVRQVLKEHFGGGFRRVGRYTYMFESQTKRAYFQNFNKRETSNLWYRLRRTALKDLRSQSKEGFVVLTNPAQGLMYVLPVEEVEDRAQKMGLGREDLEVNIDPSDDRWRELDWDLSGHLARLTG